MAATAVAQPRTRPARAPARGPARNRRVRALRTATAISDAADSRLIVRLTRSQAWIAIIGVLLTGIVALNVYSLGMGSVVSSTAERATDLERKNSLLREQIGKLRKNGEIERFAAKLGLGQPASEELIRVAARDGDAKRAAARLLGTSSAPIAAELAATPVVDAVAPDPALSAEATSADPALAVPAATTDPAAESESAATVPTGTAESTPVTPTDSTAAAAGGVAP